MSFHCLPQSTHHAMLHTYIRTELLRLLTIRCHILTIRCHILMSLLSHGHLPLRHTLTYLFLCYVCNSFHVVTSILLLTKYSLSGSHEITFAILYMSPIFITCIPYPSSFFSTRAIPSSLYGLADPRNLSSIINTTSYILAISPRTVNTPSSLATIRPSSSLILLLSTEARPGYGTYTQSAFGMRLCGKPRFHVHLT